MLKLQTIDTFTVPVKINAPGGAVEITVDFVQMPADERKAWAESDEYKTFSDADVVMKIVRGWTGVDLPFSREAVDKLVAYYPSAAFDITLKFWDEMAWNKAKEKN
jgi:hypothetical protein